MFRLKAYFVRFADDKNSHRPSPTTHLTWRIPSLPDPSALRFSLGQKSTRGAPRHVVAQSVQGGEFILHVELVRRLHNHGDPHSPLGGSDNRILDVGMAYTA